MKAQEWIDRYVFAVGEALPIHERKDVEAEIRSLIHDELDARSNGAAEDVNEAVVLEVLQHFGRPEEFAARYHAPRSLIGPALYPIFRIVSTIVLTVLFGVWLFGVAVDVGMYQRPFTNPLGMFGDLIGDLLQTFGTLVLIFALVEAFLRGQLEAEIAAERKKEPWNPKSLPKAESTERPKIGELVIGIGFNLVAILIFNAYPEWIAAIFVRDGEMTRIPLLSQNFAVFVPWLTLLWTLSVALSVLVLIQGRWQPLTRWLQIGLSALGVAILGWMLVSGPLLAWEALEPVATMVIAIIFAVAMIDVAVQVFRQIRRQVRDMQTV
ncbi:MAG: hypothetical protein ACK4SA_02105 [Caldilinea sp.]